MSPIHHIGKSKKRAGERMRLVTFRVKCFVWNDKDGAGPFAGFGFASDISENGAGIYLDQEFAKGTPLRISFEDEKSEPYFALVAWCRRFSLNQRFHAQANLEYHVGLQLLFASDGDRQRYLMHFNDLRKQAAAIPNQFKF
jgi:hypothetical protein